MIYLVIDHFLLFSVYSGEITCHVRILNNTLPMQESLASEHGCELLRDALEELLYGSAVANEGARHL